MVLNSLLKSRKFWLSLVGVVQAVVLHYLSVPEEIWQSIMALIGVLITMIAVEDAAEKRAGQE
jgi:xanthine/uracil/vitamin C permease (AzgA family)